MKLLFWLYFLVLHFLGCVALAVLALYFSRPQAIDYSDLQGANQSAAKIYLCSIGVLAATAVIEDQEGVFEVGDCSNDSGGDWKVAPQHSSFDSGAGFSAPAGLAARKEGLVYVSFHDMPLNRVAIIHVRLNSCVRRIMLLKFASHWRAVDQNGGCA